MKPFRFSLQPVRVLREQKEQKAQQTFGEAIRACDEATFQLRVASEELVSAWNTLCHDISTGVNASHLARTRAWCNVLELRQKERAEALQHAQRTKDAAMKQMLVATRDRETIDNYHDKRLDAHNYLVRREEQKNLDEVGLRRTSAASSMNALHRAKDL